MPTGPRRQCARPAASHRQPARASPRGCRPLPTHRPTADGCRLPTLPTADRCPRTGRPLPLPTAQAVRCRLPRLPTADRTRPQTRHAAVRAQHSDTANDTADSTANDTANDTAESRCTQRLRAVSDTANDTHHDTDHDTHHSTSINNKTKNKLNGRGRTRTAERHAHTRTHTRPYAHPCARRNRPPMASGERSSSARANCQRHRRHPYPTMDQASAGTQTVPLAVWSCSGIHVQKSCKKVLYFGKKHYLCRRKPQNMTS